MLQMKKNLSGLGLALALAALATWLESLLPIHLIGASVIALFLGMIINSVGLPQHFQPGLKFTSKKVLKFAIILLGASLNIKIIVDVGKLSFTVLCFTMLTCFGGGYFIGKALKLNWKLSNLISAGTGICGGSAIAAIAPVIEAEDKDIAYAMSATFLFDIAMILLFPFMGEALSLSPEAYGLWAGTAVNDTSSVVAAGYAYGEEAGDFATMVKLTRTLSIIPTVLIFAGIHLRLSKKENAENTGKKVDIISLLPWFIVGFLAMAFANSMGLIPEEISILLKECSKFFMVASLASIGMNTSVKEMKKSGVTPMIHGFIISLLVVIVAITVEWSMGMV